MPVRTSPMDPNTLVIDQWVTVMGPNLAKEATHLTEDPSSIMEGESKVSMSFTPSRQLLTIMGVPVQVKAILLPFVLVQLRGPDNCPTAGCIIDMRRTILAPMSEEFKNEFFRLSDEVVHYHRSQKSQWPSGPGGHPISPLAIVLPSDSSITGPVDDPLDDNDD